MCLVSASKCIIKLIDFGSCVCGHDTRNSYIQSRWYRAPEVMLGIHWDAKVDMWSLGCLLAELLLGYPIFHGNTVSAVLAAQQAVIGPHPDSLLNASPKNTYQMYFTPRRQLYSIDPPGKPEGAYEMVPQPISLSELLPIDNAPLLSFISSLLQYDPKERPSATSALQHPFILAHLLKKQRSPKEERESPISPAPSPKPTPSPKGVPTAPGSTEPAGRRGSGSETAWQPAAGRSTLPSEAAFWSKARRKSGDSEGDNEVLSAQLTQGNRNLSLDNFKDGVIGYDSNSSIPSRASSVEGSRNGSPIMSARPTDGQKDHQSATRGPGVPEEFRNAVRSSESREGRAHDWKARLARFIGTTSQGSGRNRSGRGSPTADQAWSEGAATWMRGEGPSPWSGDLLHGHITSAASSNSTRSSECSSNPADGGATSASGDHGLGGSQLVDGFDSDSCHDSPVPCSPVAEQTFLQIPGSPATMPSQVPPRQVGFVRRKKGKAGN